MTDYVAFIKKLNDSKPHKMTFSANNVSQAIKVMLNKAKLGSTAEVSEYELLEVVGKDGYRTVASRGGDLQKPLGKPKQTETKAASPPVTYSPYKVSVL